MPDSHHFGEFDFVGVAAVAVALVGLDPCSPSSRKCLKTMYPLLKGRRRQEGEDGCGEKRQFLDPFFFVSCFFCSNIGLPAESQVGGPVEKVSFFQIVHVSKVGTQIHSSISQYDV